MSTSSRTSPDSARSTAGAAALCVERATGDGLVAVALEEGVAELSRAVLLRGTARRMLETHGAALSQEDCVAELLDAGAATREDAESDARSFLGELEASGLRGARLLFARRDEASHAHVGGGAGGSAVVEAEVYW